MNAEKQNSILCEIYRSCYKASTPSADFDELIKDAEANNRRGPNGGLDIEFHKYSMKRNDFDDIFEAAMKKHRVPKHMWSRFSTTLHLGATPCFIKE